MSQRDDICTLRVIDDVGVPYKGALYNRSQTEDGQMTVDPVDVVVGRWAQFVPTSRACMDPVPASVRRY